MALYEIVCVKLVKTVKHYRFFLNKTLNLKIKFKEFPLWLSGNKSD